MVDLGAVATFLVAVATMVLAAVSYFSVRQNKREVNMLVRQTMLMKSQQDPIPLVKSFSFKGNSMRIEIENSGNGPASSLAIACSFVLARRTFFVDAEGKIPLSGNALEEAIREKKQTFMRYDLEIERTLLDEGKNVYPTAVACQLVNEDRDTTILLPRESYEYNLELKFGLGPEKGDPTSFPPFDSLVEFLRSNEIICFSVDFDLIGKNAAEDPIQRQGLAMFVVDLLKHKSLEEAYAERRRPGYEPLEYMEVARKIPLSVEAYLQSKTLANYPKYFEEGKAW